MAPKSLPPGFRFRPTDEELVAYYLARKITGRTIELELIPEVDLYKCEPWVLPEKSLLPSGDMEWYFYSPRDKKYPNGSRTNRATKGGYWKATGKDRMVVSQRIPMGMRKTLVYYKGRAPHGIRTNWIMHEYRLLDSSPCLVSPSLKDSYVLCRIFKKTAPSPKATEVLRDQKEKDPTLLLKRSDEFDYEDDYVEEDVMMDLSNEMLCINQIDTPSSSDVTQNMEVGAGQHGMQPLLAIDEAMSPLVFDFSSFHTEVPGFLDQSLYQPAETGPVRSYEAISGEDKSYICSSAFNLHYSHDL